MLISLECAKAACSENHVELLYKWISEGRYGRILRFFCKYQLQYSHACLIYNRLTCSFEMAQLVERLNALDLAEFIYRKVKAHYEVAVCLLKTGK